MTRLIPQTIQLVEVCYYVSKVGVGVGLAHFSNVVFQPPLTVIMHAMSYCFITVVFKFYMHSAILTSHCRHLFQYIQPVSFSF